jgi:hypothetical protein
MLLQHAIILGDTLKMCDPFDWLSEDGSCGCAFGGALLAAGVDAKKFNEQFGSAQFLRVTELPVVQGLWPWLTHEHTDRITKMYHELAKGYTTIEEIAAYVRSVEPVVTAQSELTPEKETVSV